MSWLKRWPTKIAASLAATLLCVALSVYVDQSLGVILFAGFVVLVMSIYSQLQHHNALEGKRLNWLRSEGFTLENIGRYSGYKGTYQGYFTRIYVNPTSRFYRRIGPDLCILIYFHPMRRPDGKRNMALLRRIEADLLNEWSWFQWEFLTCHAIHMHQRTRFRLFTNRKRIKKHLDRVVGKLTHYGLMPWPEADVDRWVRDASDLHAPDMEEFRENFPIREGSY